MFKSLRSLSPAETLVVAVTGLLPVVHSLLLARYYRTPQLAVLVMALGGLLAVALSGAGSWLKQETKPVRLSVLLLGGAVAWMTISAFVGLDSVRSFMGHELRPTGLVMWYAVFALYVAAIRHRGSLAVPVSAAVNGAWVVMLVFLAVWVLARDLAQEFLVPVTDTGVPLPGVGSSWGLGAFAGVGLLVAAGRSISGARGLPWVVLSVFLAAYLTVTEARVPIIITAVLLAAGLLAALRNGVRRWLVAGLGISVLTAAVLSHVFLIGYLQDSGSPQVQGGDISLARRFDPDNLASGAGFRLAVWSVGARTVIEDPWFGVGPANFTYAFRENATLTDIARTSESPEMDFQDAHNIFVETAATGGLPAALMLIGAVLSCAWACFTPSSGRTWLRLSALALLALHLVEPMSLVLTPLMAIFGAVGATGNAPARDEVRKIPLRRVLAGAAIVTASLVAVSMIYSDYLLAKGLRNWDGPALERAITFDPTCQQCLFQLGKVRSWEFKKEGKGTELKAIAPFERAVRRRPEDAEAYLRLGTGLIFLDRPDRAVEALNNARRLNPNSAATVLALGGAYFEAGDPSAALKSALESIRIEPSARAWGLVADSSLQLGLVDQAERALQQARNFKDAGR